MKYINRVWIRYFRSVHNVSIKGCQDLNIFSGRNDVGKSNILKALNLFFNEKTDWNTPFDFHADFSTKRLERVREASIKGKQLVSIKVEFLGPSNYKGSLPKRFTVTRTWLRRGEHYLESHNLETLEKHGELPSTLETARRFLSQFLNRIHFEYVPAVKDREYFKYTLSNLQTHLLGSSLIPDSTLVSDLATHIQDQVAVLKQDFLRATNLEISIEPPSKLAVLFQAFLISTQQEEGNIPLFLRGDGLQARFLPCVLHYISSRSSDFFIWGFEEPENSLEYSHCKSLAKDFATIYSKDAQIFVTTHSPAFVSRSDASCSCYRCYNEDDATSVACVWPAKINETVRERLFEELGLLNIQQEVHKQFATKLERLALLEEKTKELKNELTKATMPLLLVEGKHDKQTIDTAWKKLFPSSQCPFIIRSADPVENHPDGGAAGADSVARMVEALHPADGRQAIGLFDYDDKGIKAFKSLSKNFTKLEGYSNCKKHKNELAYAMLLPVPVFRRGYAKAHNLTLELLFSDHVIDKKTDEGNGLILIDQAPVLLLGEKRVNLTPDMTEQLNEIISIPGYRRIESGKKVFAEEIVPTCAVEEFEEFRKLFFLLAKVVGIEIAPAE